MTPVEALQRCALFRDLSETGLRIFASVAREKALPAGSPLFVENMMGEALFVVVSGAVKITRRGPDGERELAILGPGEHLGALAVLARSIRLVSAVAATSCQVLELTRADFVRLQADKPQACLKLAVAIATDLAARMAENRDAFRELPPRPAAG